MQLKATNRTVLGKSVDALRKQGLIPAELYGHGVDNVHLAVDAKEFRKVFKDAGENTVIDLKIGEDSRKALVHGIQRDSVHDTIDHIDFYQVNMNEAIRTRVPIELVGEAPAVKTHGGVLNRTMTEIEVEALPAEIPQKFTVDLGILAEIGQSVYVKDLDLPKGVAVDVDPETVIVSISEPAKEEEALPAAAPSVADVKVESEEKKAEREKEKAQSETQ